MIEKSANLICLHGLGKNAKRMQTLADFASDQGFIVFNESYPSTQFSVSALTDLLYQRFKAKGLWDSSIPLYFVGHSLGALLIRSLISRYRPDNLARVVMLAPPNQGSEVANFLARFKWYQNHYGPAGMELVTGPSGIAAQLPLADYEVGIIAGDRSIDPWFSYTLLPGPDDGKVTVASTRLQGMQAHCVMHATHPGMPNNVKVIARVMRYLKEGSF